MSKLLRVLSLVGALSLAATVAGAAGLNLMWGDCALAPGTQNKTFACTSNSGSNVLYGSYIAPTGIIKQTGEEMVLDLLTENAGSFSQWWAFKNTGTCRQNALTVNFAANASGACLDYWGDHGGALGNIAAYTIGQGGTTNRARLLLVAAVDQNLAGPVDDTSEYYSFALAISNQKTVGTGACTGCTDKVCIVLNSINITQPLGVGDFLVSNEATSRIATWQSETASTCLPVPARNRTWGQVKSLYR